MESRAIVQHLNSNMFLRYRKCGSYFYSTVETELKNTKNSFELKFFSMEVPLFLLIPFMYLEHSHLFTNPNDFATF